MSAMLVMSGCSSDSSGSPRPALDDWRALSDGPRPVLRVAAWNIETVGAEGSEQYLAAASVLARIDVDVVGIAEVSSTADEANLQALALATGYSEVVVSTPLPGAGLRNAFLSRVPIDQSVIHTSPSLSGDLVANDLTRNIPQIHIDSPGDRADLTLLMVHWKSGGSNGDEVRRVIESIRVEQAIAPLDPSRDAYIIMGDLNEEISDLPLSPPQFDVLPPIGSASYTLGVDLLEEFPGLFNDPFVRLTDPFGPAATIVGAQQLDGSWATFPSSGRRLDYVLVSPRLQWMNPQTEVYSSEHDDLLGGLPKAGAPLTASTSVRAADHLPVVIDVPLPPGQCEDTDPCDDLNACTLDSCELDGYCSSQPVADGTPCMDAGSATCQAGMCVL